MTVTITVLADPDRRPELAAAIAGWLPKQRWYAGKARTLDSVTVADAFVISADGVDVLDVFVDARYLDGHKERYQLPLVDDPDADPDAEVATIDGLRLVDAAYVPDAAKLLPTLVLEAHRSPTPTGAELVCRPVGEPPAELGAAKRMSAEQSNTSIALGDTHIYKIFRRLETGVNPDVEVTRALTEAGFPNTPAQRGAVELHTPAGDVVVLGVLVDFVVGAKDAWALATSEVANLGDPAAPRTMLEKAGDLGTAVGELHATLRDTLGTRDAALADHQRWADAMRRQVEAVLATARERAPEACEPVLAGREQILKALQQLQHDDTPTPLTRTHGDLHLGQVLLDAGGAWQILDFEGEPARSLAERRDLHAPLRDVAGMLRSFDYAAAVGSGGDLSDVRDQAAQWRDDARRTFLDAYLITASKHGVLPANPDVVAAQLDAFELDKAVYELGYELANRPDWVSIPVGGITRVLHRRSTVEGA